MPSHDVSLTNDTETKLLSVFAEAMAGGPNLTPKCQPVNLSNTWAPSDLCQTLRQWVELFPHC